MSCHVSNSGETWRERSVYSHSKRGGDEHRINLSLQKSRQSGLRPFNPAEWSPLANPSKVQTWNYISCQVHTHTHRSATKLINVFLWCTQSLWQPLLAAVSRNTKPCKPGENIRRILQMSWTYILKRKDTLKLRGGKYVQRLFENGRDFMSQYELFLWQPTQAKFYHWTRTKPDMSSKRYIWRSLLRSDLNWSCLEKLFCSIWRPCEGTGV